MIQALRPSGPPPSPYNGMVTILQAGACSGSSSEACRPRAGGNASEAGRADVGGASALEVSPPWSGQNGPQIDQFTY